MAKKTADEEMLAPLRLLQSLDREQLEEQLKTAEAEIAAFIAEKQQSIGALKVLLKAAKIRDGIEVRKKRQQKQKPSQTMAPTRSRGDDGERENGGGQAVMDFRSIALKVRKAILHGGPQSIEGLIQAVGCTRDLMESYLTNSPIVTRQPSGKYALVND